MVSPAVPPSEHSNRLSGERSTKQPPHQPVSFILRKQLILQEKHIRSLHGCASASASIRIHGLTLELVSCIYAERRESL